MKYLVVIPTYNEKNSIEAIIEKIIKLKSYDILVVDDNSPDKTSELVLKKMNNYKNVFLKIRKNKMGLGSAYLYGFKWAIDKKYDFVIQMDADLSHNPNDLIILTKYTNEYSLIIGSRYIDGIRIINWPISRLILSYSANLYARLITGIKIKDLTGGFKCFSINVLKNINLNKIRSEGYSFQIELNYLTALQKFKIKEVPIIFTDRVAGNSKMSKKIIFEALYMVPYLRIRNILSFFIND